MFPLVEQLPSTLSAEDRSPLFERFAGTTCSSDSPLTYMLVVELVAFSSRSGLLLPDTSGVSRFSRMEFSDMPGVSDCAGSVSDSRFRHPRYRLPPRRTASTPRTRLISQLNTLPACAPVNASPAALRRHTHDSGSGWFATPFLWDSFIPDSMPVYPGALRVHSRLKMLSR